MRSLLSALAFLTVIPVGRLRCVIGWGGGVGGATMWFPVVGFLIGMACGGVLLLGDALLPGPLPEVLTVVFLIGLTGALHLDGLADTFDGLFGGGDRAERLRIMRDAGVGVYGLAAVVCVVFLRVAVLMGLGEGEFVRGVFPAPQQRWMVEVFGRLRWVQVAVVMLAPMWGRWAMVLAAGVGPYARTGEGGVGAEFVRRTGLLEAVLLLLLPAGASGLLLGVWGMVAGAVVAAISIGVLLWWRGRIGGVTGDTMGALGEVSEVLFALAALVLLPMGGGVRY